MSFPAGRTIGAGLGAAIFVIFFAEMADRIMHPASAATPSSYSISVTP